MAFQVGSRMNGADTFMMIGNVQLLFGLISLPLLVVVQNIL